jgi:pimeloyl-ACP methyl ester carboxylesterase
VSSPSLEALREQWPAQALELPCGQASLTHLRQPGLASPGALPVLFLPGAHGTAEVFCHQLLAWSGRREMAAFTYPALIGAAALAQSVVEALDYLGWAQADIVSTSLGGFIAQHLALGATSRVGRLVLGNAFIDPAPVQSRERLAFLQGAGAQAAKDQLMTRVDSARPSEMQALQQALMGQAQSAETLLTRLLTIQLAAPVSPVAFEPGRVLVIECDNDPMVSQAMRLEMRAAYPQARQARIEGGGHNPFVTHALQYNTLVSGFLGIEDSQSPSAQPACARPTS